ncbi:MAG: SRPBCC family protein [Solirubrobacteraceae bacterium]
MKPVRVTTDVPQPIDEVYDFLDVMANHEPFTDHILRDWEYSGPDRGVGSRARVHVSAAGRTDTVDIEVVDAERPTRIVERNIGAGGRRVANGTYTLSALPSGGTHVQFEYTWSQIPLSERVMSPVVRGMLRRANERAMARLAERLQTAAGV